MSEPIKPELVENEDIDKKLETATIDELQKMLDDKIVELEDLEKSKSKLETDNSGLQDELTKERRKTMSLEDRVTALESQGDKLVKELEKTNKELEKSNVELEMSREETRKAKRDPYVTKLKELDAKGFYSDELIEVMTVDMMKAKIELLENEANTASKIEVTTITESVEGAKKPEENELTELEQAIKLRDTCIEGSDMWKYFSAKIEELSK